MNVPLILKFMVIESLTLNYEFFWLDHFVIPSTSQRVGGYNFNIAPWNLDDVSKGGEVPVWPWILMQIGGRN